MSDPISALPVLVARQAESDLDRLKRLALCGIASEETRRAYAKGLADFLLWFEAERRGPLSKRIVEEYRAALGARELAPSTINVRLSAVRRLAEQAHEVGLLTPGAAAAIARVRGVPKRGTRVGNWLTKEQARDLLCSPDAEKLQGKRDRAVLGLLVGCGLRRSELTALDLADILQREARWVIADFTGKGKRVRTVAVPAWVKVLLDEWTAAAGLREGRIVLPIDKGGRIAGSSVTSKVIWSIVVRCARRAGIDKAAPHDLRRTCAKLCRGAGGDMEQIQMLLGHASIQTTEQYLGTKQNLVEAVNDRLGLDV